MIILNFNNEKIPLAAICAACEWHRLSIIDALTSKGLDRQDATSYTEYMLTLNARHADCEPQDCLDDEQLARLEFTSDNFPETQSDERN